jgi:hypothetical protein
MTETFDLQIAELAARQHGVIARRQATELGATRWTIGRRLRRGWWQEVQPGVYALAGTPDSYDRRVIAAVLSAPAGSVASHRTAAALHGMPGFGRTIVEVTAPDGPHPAMRIGKTTRHFTNLLPSHHRKTLHDIPTTTVARTLFDLCAVVDPGRAERAVDNCLSRRWVTLPALWRVLDELAIQGRNGTRALREILMPRSNGYVAPASELERRFLELVQRFGFPTPEREVDLGDPDQWIGRVEFVFRPQNVLVEIDSYIHHSSLLDRRADADRDSKFGRAGFKVVRIRDYELDDAALVERRLSDALRDAVA